jgi:hypothetical protein
MRRASATGPELGEDVTEKAGWMYADLFLALMVIFLATISFVPNTRTAPPASGNTQVTPQVSLNSINMTSGMADLYTKFDPIKVKSDIENFKKTNSIPADSEAIYVQIIGGYDPAIEKINAATVTAINFSVDMKAQLPEVFGQAAFKIDVSETIPSKSVAIRITFAPKIGS